MKNRYLLFVVFGFLSVRVNAELASVTLEEVLKHARTQSPEIQLRHLETMAEVREAETDYGKVLPEIGLEGGARSSREKEKRNDEFYYGYARYELSLREIFELKAALAKRRLAEHENKFLRSQMERLVAERFFEAVVRQEQIKLKEDDVKLTDQQMQRARKRKEGGVATNTDILEFQLHQQELRNDLDLLRQDFIVQTRELQRLTGMASPPLNLEANFPLPPSSLPSVDELWPVVSSKNFELAKARGEAEVAKAESRASFGEWLPRLSVEGQYGKLMETDFYESNKNSWEVIGKVTILIFTGTSGLRDYQSKSFEAERTELQSAQEEIKLRNKLTALVERIEKLRVNLEGEQKNVETGEAYYQSVVSEYRRGVKNSPDMASATDKLFSTKERLIETKRTLSSAYLELLTMQGRTLDD